MITLLYVLSGGGEQELFPAVASVGQAVGLDLCFSVPWCAVAFLYGVWYARRRWPANANRPPIPGGGATGGV